MEKQEHLRHILFSSIEGQKHRRRPKTFAPCMGTMPSERTRQENGFKDDRFDICRTPRSGKSSGFDDDSLNTFIHNDPRHCRPTRQLENVMNCAHSTIVRHFHSMDKVKKIGCMDTACSRPNRQKSAGGDMCISACSPFDWLVNNIDHSYPVLLL